MPTLPAQAATQLQTLVARHDLSRWGCLRLLLLKAPQALSSFVVTCALPFSVSVSFLQSSPAYCETEI